MNEPQPFAKYTFTVRTLMAHDVHTRALATLSSVVEAYSTVLFLADPSSKNNPVYRLAGKFSLGDLIDPLSVIEPGKGLVGWIAKANTILSVPNFERHKKRLEYYKGNEEMHIKAFMGCSLPDGKGVLCVDSKRQYSFSDKDQKLLHLFAQLIAEQLDIHNRKESLHTIDGYYNALKELYALRHRYSRWSDFLQNFISVTTMAAGCSYGVFCYTNNAKNEYVVEGETSPLVWKPKSQAPAFSMNSGAIGWVCRNGEAFASNSPTGMPESSLFGKGVTTPQFQTVMAQPIVIQRKMRGVFCLANELSLELTGETQDFVRMATEHLALFLENLYIKSRLQEVSVVAASLQERHEQESEPGL